VRRAIPTILGLFFLASTLSLAQESKPPAPTRGPRIAVEPPSFDFGKALKDRELTKEFSVRNFGNQDLVIDRVSTDCGCTTAGITTPSTVKPGGSVVMQVTLRTNVLGHITKKVLINSNDPANKPYEVKIQATVVAPN